MGITRRVLLGVVLSHVVSILGVVIVSIVTVDKAVDPVFAAQWITARVTILWISYFIPITVLGILLFFGYFLSSRDLKSAVEKSQSPSKSLNGTLVVSMIFLAVFTFLLAFAEGSSRTSLEDSRLKSSRIREIRDSLQAWENGTNRSAETANRVLALVEDAIRLLPKDSMFQKKRDQLLQSISASRASDGSAAANSGKTSPQPKGAKESLESLRAKAETAGSSGDWFSQWFYAQSAMEIMEKTGVVDTRLQEMMESARSNINQLALTEKDSEAARILRMKQTAILEKRISSPEEAYALLLQIEASASGRSIRDIAAITDIGDYKDSDVRKWMPDVLDRLKARGFWYQELQAATDVSTGPVLVLNRKNDQSTKNYLYAREIVRGAQGFYLIEPELLGFGPDGERVRDVKSDYGKVVGNEDTSPDGAPFRIQLRTLASDGSKAVWEPKDVLAHSYPNIDEAIRTQFLDLYVDPATLWSLSKHNMDPATLSVPETIDILGKADQLGYDPSALQASLVRTLSRIATFPVMIFLAIGFSWAHRSRYVAKNIFLTAFALLLTPAFALASVQLFDTIVTNLSIALFLFAGLSAAIPILLTFFGVLVFLSLLYVSTKISR